MRHVHFHLKLSFNGIMDEAFFSCDRVSEASLPLSDRNKLMGDYFREWKTVTINSESSVTALRRLVQHRSSSMNDTKISSLHKTNSHRVWSDGSFF